MFVQGRGHLSHILRQHSYILQVEVFSYISFLSVYFKMVQCDFSKVHVGGTKKGNGFIKTKLRPNC